MLNPLIFKISSSFLSIISRKKNWVPIKKIKGKISKRVAGAFRPLNIIGKKDLKILNWTSQSKPRQLAKLSKVFFSIKNHSVIFKAILKEGVNEIEMILKYMIEVKKIPKIFLVGGLSKLYMSYIKKKYLNY